MGYPVNSNVIAQEEPPEEEIIPCGIPTVVKSRGTSVDSTLYDHQTEWGLSLQSPFRSLVSLQVVFEDRTQNRVGLDITRMETTQTFTPTASALTSGLAIFQESEPGVIQLSGR